MMSKHWFNCTSLLEIIVKSFTLSLPFFLLTSYTWSIVNASIMILVIHYVVIFLFSTLILAVDYFDRHTNELGSFINGSLLGGTIFIFTGMLVYFEVILLLVFDCLFLLLIIIIGISTETIQQKEDEE